MSHISCNDATWHSYTLPKEDPKSIWITRHTLRVLLTSAFFHSILLYQEIQIQIVFWYIISNSFDVFESLRIVLTNMVTILMMSAKMATLGLLKKRYFEIKVMTS